MVNDGVTPTVRMDVNVGKHGIGISYVCDGDRVLVDGNTIITSNDVTTGNICCTIGPEVIRCTICPPVTVGRHHTVSDVHAVQLSTSSLRRPGRRDR